MRLPAGYASRPATWQDLDEVVSLFKATDRADAGVEDPVRGHLDEQWRLGTFDLASDSALVFAPDGTLAAYAEVAGLNPELSLDVHGRIHPDHRGRGLGGEIVTWGEERALARTPPPPKIYQAVPGTDDVGRDLLERRGYAYVRTFQHLERELGDEVEPPAPLDGIEVRPYRHPEDSLGVYEALDEAFRDHWGFEPYPMDVHDEQISRADPAITPVALADGEVVGVAYSRLVEDVGWVDSLGVRAAWRGKGIATALLRSTFAGMAGLGATKVMLNVDAENATGATRLYESVGMHLRRSWLVFEKALGAA